MHGNLKKKKKSEPNTFHKLQQICFSKKKKKTFNNKSYKPQNLTFHEHILT